jgi:SAM-dependent methyltransferase
MGNKHALRREEKAKYYKKDFWSKESQKFVRPHFRLEKASRIANKIARGRKCDLLDVGCGPTTLMCLLDSNISYYGIDIAIRDPAPNLLEVDLLENPIGFNGRQFDIIMAQGIFEYMGGSQAQKFTEISDLLRDGGKFVVSYINFDHRSREILPSYSNVQSFHEFRNDLAQHFSIERLFPASHNWHHGQPTRRLVMATQKHLNLNIPLVSPPLAVEYFFICSRHGPERRTTTANSYPVIGPIQRNVEALRRQAGLLRR